MCDINGNHEACTCDTTTSEHHGHSHEHQHVDDHAATPAVSASYGVAGMTCSHCVSSVTEELSRLDGVKDVNVDLVAGGISRVTVASDTTLDRNQVTAAIDEAGYELADLPR